MSTDGKRRGDTVGRVAFAGTENGRRGPRSVAQADQRARKHHRNTTETT